MNLVPRFINPGILIFLSLLFSHANSQAQTKKSREVSQARFIAGSSSQEIPFELSNNLVLVQAKVNDSAPVWFIFDTGAEWTVIDTALAKKLRLKPAGKVVETGGTGTAEALKFGAVSLQLPNIEISALTTYGLPLDSFSSPLGKRIGGVIGYDVIKKFAIELDYVARKISFYEPETYQYSGAGETFPLTFMENMPFITASVALEGRVPISGKFEIDSGSTGAVLFNTPFVKKHNLLRSISQTSEIRIGGVGGTAQAYLGRVKKIIFGHFSLANPVTRLSQGARGDNASAKYDGLIGGEILRRFKTIFDYSRHRMILEPNALVAAPFELDMSGMELLADGDDLSTVLIDEVKLNSPAAEAGVRGGDVLAGIDNHPIREFTLEEIRQMFKQDQREYLLLLKRDGKQVRAKIKLRRLI